MARSTTRDWLLSRMISHRDYTYNIEAHVE